MSSRLFQAIWGLKDQTTLALYWRRSTDMDPTDSNLTDGT